MKILIEFVLLSKPFRLKRCTEQLIHFAHIAENLGHTVHAITDASHILSHPSMRQIRHLWTEKRTDCDLYIAKSDAYHLNRNWDIISGLKCFKVCLNNSDRCLRESAQRYDSDNSGPVQDRCDLYMPVNHTIELLLKYPSKVVPVIHPIDPRMVKVLQNCGLYDAYLNDDIYKIREYFKEDEIGIAGFMGNPSPIRTRKSIIGEFPQYVDFNWERSKPSRDYIKWMMQRRGCIDLRGNGDKSLRFSEGVLLGRTMICTVQPSIVRPILFNDHNCLIARTWSGINWDYNREKWQQIADCATHDYCGHWSLKSQFNLMVSKA